MKRRVKQIIAFICATIMTVSGCLIDGVIVSRADGTSAEGSGPVIKFNNPGIGVNVGDTIDLTKYAVQFTDGVDTEAENVQWLGKGKIYKIPFASPAIPAIAGETLQLSQYKVQLEEGGDYVAVESWYDGEVNDENLITEFTPEKGVSQLTAKFNETTEKYIYVVAKDEADEEYVLYYNDFNRDYGNNTDTAIYSYADFINKPEVNNVLTKLRTSSGDSKYDIENGLLTINRYTSSGTSKLDVLNIHLFFPYWLGAFGDYKVEMVSQMDSFGSDRAFVGIDLRAQLGNDVTEGIFSTTSSYIPTGITYLKDNYSVRVERDTKMEVSKSPSGCNGTKDMNAIGETKTIGVDNISVKSKFTMTAQVNDHVVDFAVLQDEKELAKTTADLSEDEKFPRTGRLGVWVYQCKASIDSFKVSLVVDELECIETNDFAITSFTPEAEGVYELTAKDTTNGTTKTIYIVTKNENDTEYVLYENDFNTEADAAELVVSKGGDTESEVTVSDSQLQFVVKDSVHYKINDAKLKNFGNYRIEMTATTTSASGGNSNITDGLGLFARESYDEAKGYQSYATRLKYKYFDSDGAALSFDKQLAWGKYAYTYAHLNEEYVHSMRVQDDLVEYQITNSAGKTGTILYDVREKELKTGDVGFLFQHTADTTYKVNINKVRVLFCPDETVPNAPVQAKYTRTTAIAGMADGTVTVNLSETGSPAKDVVCYWGDADGNKLAGYTNFSRVLVPDDALTVTVDLGSNIMVPQGAKKLLVYTENFQGMSSECIEVDLPEKLAALSLGTEVQSFQVISDTHIKAEDDYASTNFEKFLEKVLTNDANTSGIFIGGDLVDSGAEEEYQHFNEIYASNDKLPRMYSIIGNHEFWFGDDSAESWQANMDRYYQYTLSTDELEKYSKPYYAREIDGTKFIFLNSEEKESAKPTDARLSDAQVKFLETEMASAEAGKPTFIFLHQPLAGTVAGSTSEGVDKSAEIKAILANYPQAILFTSHSHVDLDQPGTMVAAGENGCNMFNTAAVSYLMNKHYTSANMTYEGAQGYYVEVYADKVLVRGKNLVTNEWMPSAQFVVFMEEQENEVLFEDSYDFTTTQSVGYLEDAFVAHQYNKPLDRKSSYAVADDKTVADYFRLNYGLMANTVPENGYTILTYNKADLKNFEVEYQFTNSGTSATGLIFGGQPGTLPITFDGNADNDYGVALYMTNDGAMYVYGAVDSKSAVSGTKATDEAIYPSVEGAAKPTDTTYVEAVSYVYAPNMASANDGDNTYTICVKVSNNRLTVYEKDNHKSALTVDLTENYKSGYVSLFATDAEYGRFEKFQVQELRAWDYDMSVVFGGARTKYLDDAFDAYFYTRSNNLYSKVHGSTNKAVEPSYIVPKDSGVNNNGLNSFTSTDNTGYLGTVTVGALKAFNITGPSSEGTEKSLGGNAGSAVLTYTKHLVNEFRVEYDFFPGKDGSKDVRNGLLFGGEAGIVPLSRDNIASNDVGVALYMTQDGTLYVYGAIDAVNTPDAPELTVVRNQDTTNVDGVAHVVITGMTDGEVPANPEGYVDMTTTHYTMCVTVKDGILSVYEKNHPDRVAKIPLADTYQGGNVSLFTNSKQYGGFGGFRIQRLENYDFTELGLEGLDKYFYSYRFNKDTAVPGTTGEPTEQWKESAGTLIPSSSSANTILTLEDRKVTNFEASTTFTFTKGKGAGIMVAPEGTIVSYNSGYKSNPGGLLVCFDGINSQQRLYIYGAVDAANAEWTGTTGSLFSTTNGYIRTADTGLVFGQEYVMHMKVENGVVSAWIDGLEGKLSAKLNGNYVGGNVSLFANATAGGFKNFSLTPFEDAKATARTELPVKITPVNGGAKLTISTGLAESKLQGVLNYDADVFTVSNISYIDELTTKLNTVVGTTLTDESGKISLDDMLSIGAGKVLTIDFVGDSLDYSKFFIEEPNVITAGGREVACVDSEVEVAFDYKADQIIDARDLVKGKKNGTSVKSLRRILIGEPISIVSEDFTFVIPEATYENGKLVTLGNSGTTTIYSDCTVTLPNTNSRIHCKLLGPVTFDGVTFNVENKDSATSDIRLYAQGYDFVVNDNVVFTEGSYIKNVYGGKLKEEVESTNLTISAGNYSNIYGGGYQGNVVTDTNVFVGGNVNSGINPWNHDETNKIYGGGYNAVVGGNSYVTIAGDAKANIVYGGGYDGSASAKAKVNGTCYIDIKGGKVMGYYGGNRQGLDTAVKHTVITMTAGETEQIFGGSDRQSMALEGSTTNVTVTGGTVIRRIYGGCYNDATKESLTSLSWASSHYVNGTTTVTLGEGANYSTSATSDFSDAAICASSRYKTNQEAEKAILKFQTQTVYNKLKGRTTVLNPSSLEQIVLNMPTGYDEYWIAGVKQ